MGKNKGPERKQQEGKKRRVQRLVGITGYTTKRNVRLRQPRIDNKRCSPGMIKERSR
jgi:hypothetical protein